MARTKSERMRATDFTECYPVNLMIKVLNNVENGSVGDYSIADFLTEVSNLDGKRGEVLELRFRDGLTLEETGCALHITRERARQLEALGLDSLSRKLRMGACKIIHQSEYAELYEKYNELCDKFNALVSLLSSSSGLNVPDVSKVVNYSESIDNLELSKRTRNCLVKARLMTVADIIAFDKDEKTSWGDLRGFGVTCKIELNAEMQRCAGYTLGW